MRVESKPRMGDKIKKEERKKERRREKTQPGKVRNPLSLQQSGENRQGSSSTSRVWNRFVGTFSLISVPGTLGPAGWWGGQDNNGGGDIQEQRLVLSLESSLIRDPNKIGSRSTEAKRYKAEQRVLTPPGKKPPPESGDGFPFLSCAARTPPSVFCGG